MRAVLSPRTIARSSARIRVAPISVPAGFPSPAQDYYNGDIDLTEMLIDDQAATFIVRVSGHSMHDAGISDGDELLVDRSKTPHDGDVVVAVLDGELTVKRLRVMTSQSRSRVVLQADNQAFPDLVVDELSELQIWGVATYCLHRLRHQAG